MSLNRVILAGRLVRDPELRYSPNGVGVCNFTIAVGRNFKSNNGQDADFINCVVFKGGAESLANYQRKGNLIGVDGRLQSRSYDDKDGKKVFVTEVVADSVQFLESKKEGNQQQNDKPYGNDAEPTNLDESQLPF
ncbi:single-stranded DNA-binding protein [Sediminibacillus massiliensis]|uniref:single-stranded DNA-binding protein n=1 Tax=Sediminibacillus massiliensis TaxID=1926277 RepID=UPI000988737E|nr:single-stranded DNA-binding protein [Sediminibacillus massiliensis]